LGFFSLVASVPLPTPVSTQRMWRRITSSSSFGRSAWWLPLEILCSLLSRSPFHLSPLSRLSFYARFVLTWFRSNQWTIISPRIFYAPDNTHEHLTRLHTLDRKNNKKRGKNC
jgi:hypothetical protein